MKTVGIISEYNPFHNGHAYHIEKAREATGAEYVVCAMSGSFVQRGEPAMFDKWSRAKMAVQNGADLVIELPVAYACQPAEIFAQGSVRLLNGLGIVDYLCFGSELGDTEVLYELAELLGSEPEEFSSLIKKQLNMGVSYPKAISAALSSYLGGSEESLSDEILKNPNNVLGIEYIKSLIQLKSSIKPAAIKRIASGHNDMSIESGIASATAIRNEIAKNGLSGKVRMALPQSVFNTLEENFASGKQPVTLESFSDIVLYKLRTMDIDEFGHYLNVREGIEHRLKRYAVECTSCEELIEAVKTKRYTRTYIQRLLCHILLGIKKSDISIFKGLQNPPYARVLAFNDKGKLLLKNIKEKSSCPIITKAADFKSDNGPARILFSLDVRSTDIYSLGYRNGRFRKAGQDFLTSPYCHRT